MINGMILIVKMLISYSSIMMSLGFPLMMYTYLNLFALPEHSRMLVTSIVETNSRLIALLHSLIVSGVTNESDVAEVFNNYFTSIASKCKNI